MRTIHAVATAVALLGAACKNDQDKQADQSSEARRDHSSRTRDLSGAKARYEAELHHRLEAMDRKLDELGERGEAEAKEAARQLRVNRDELAEHLAKARDTAADQWSAFKSDLDSSFDKLDHQLDDALHGLYPPKK